MIHQIDPRLNLYRVKRKAGGNITQVRNGNVTIITQTPTIDIDATIQVIHAPRRTVIRFVIARPTWTRIPGKPPHVRKLRYIIESVYDAITIEYARRIHIPSMARIEQVAVDRILEARKERQNERTYRD